MEERARRIVDTAIELAEKGGYEAVRLRDVASHAGVALGTVYKRFRSKEDILVAALDRDTASFEELLREQAIPGGCASMRANTFFQLATQAFLAKPNFARAVLRAVASGDQGVTEKVARFHGRVTRLVNLAMLGGEARVPTDEEIRVAEILQDIWFAALVGWMGGLHDVEQIHANIQFASERLLPASQ
jgi:AcrR family transcriptional regulator